MNEEPLCVHYHVCERQEYCNGKKCSDYVEERPKGSEACSQCEFSSNQGWEMPCKECMHACEDRFLRADRKGGAE